MYPTFRTILPIIEEEVAANSRARHKGERGRERPDVHTQDSLGA